MTFISDALEAPERHLRASTTLLRSFSSSSMKMLDILNKEDQSMQIKEDHMIQIKEYLTMLDLIMEIDNYTLFITNGSLKPYVRM